MKKILLLVFIAVATSTVYAADGIKVRNAKVARDGDKLNVTLEIVPGKFRSNSRIHITPVVYNGEGQCVFLDPVILVGRKRNIYDKRTGETGGDRRVISRKVSYVPYARAVRYEDWMQSISVAIEQTVESCCTRTELPLAQVTGPQLLHYEISPRFNTTPFGSELSDLENYSIDNPFLHPMEGYPERYGILTMDKSKNSIAVVFRIGSAVIDPEFKDNRQILDALAGALELIEKDSNARLKHILVAGYASPEGSPALNTRLAAQRAEAVKKYLQSIMKEPMEQIFEVYNGGEDWDGLRDMVSNSDMIEKGNVVGIINSYTVDIKQRKTALQNFEGGVPYRYMLNNFYPELRAGGYVQVYYETDRKVGIDPGSPANRAAAALNRGLDAMAGNNFYEALNLMVEFKDDPRSWNLIGVCHMMEGNYEDAERYFLKAAEEGDEDAVSNMEQIRQAKKVIR